VLVFFHNSGEVEGSEGQLTIDGSFLAAIGNLIVVTANYRMGVFGFLSSGELLELVGTLLSFPSL
jgi:thyroglobulin